MGVEDYIWRTEKQKIAEGIRKQEQVKLIYVDEDKLKSFYKHAKSMLYNENGEKPGRCIVLKRIKNQRLNCNIELFLRYLENNIKLTRYSLLEDIFETIRSTDYSKYTVKDLRIMDNCKDFCNIPDRKSVV